MSGYFVAGTGTDIGKTLVTAALIHQLRSDGKNACAVKPVMSGVTRHEANDASILLQAMGRAATDKNVAEISPWRFRAPLSVDIAASLEERTLQLTEIVSWCASQKGEPLFIESAGGVMSPLTACETMLDLADEIQLPIILVGGAYLGAFSHVLTACEAIFSRKLKLHAVVLNYRKDAVIEPRVMIENLRNRLPKTTRYGYIPELAASTRIWEHMPDLSWMDV